MKLFFSIGLLTILSLSVFGQNQLPSPRYGAAIVHYNDTTVYIYGGVVQDNNKSNNTTPSNDFYRYNPSTLTFTKITPSGEELPLINRASPVYNPQTGRIFFLGGLRTTADNSFYSFDPLSYQVAKKAQQPYSQRGGMSIAYRGSHTWLLSGGQLSNGTSSGAVYEFNTITEVFTQKADIPQGTSLHGHTTIADTANHKVYIFGGLNDSGTNNFACYQYNYQTNSWDFGPSIQNFPVNEWVADAANIQPVNCYNTIHPDEIFLAGGQKYSTTKSTNSVAISSNLYRIKLVNGNMIATLLSNNIPPMIGGVGWVSIENTNDTVFYMFGGINSISSSGDTTFSNNFYRYNQTTQQIQQYDTAQQTWGGIINSIIETEFDKKINIQVYPNPTNKEIIIAIPNNELIESINIYNQNGQLVKQITKPNNTKLNVSDLNIGLYFIRIDSTTKRYLSKMIKE
jgi:hypothetical protein